MTITAQRLHLFTALTKGVGAKRRTIGWKCKRCGQTWTALPPLDRRAGCTWRPPAC